MFQHHQVYLLAITCPKLLLLFEFIFVIFLLSKRFNCYFSITFLYSSMKSFFFVLFDLLLFCLCILSYERIIHVLQSVFFCLLFNLLTVTKPFIMCSPCTPGCTPSQCLFKRKPTEQTGLAVPDCFYYLTQFIINSQRGSSLQSIY